MVQTAIRAQITIEVRLRPKMINVTIRGIRLQTATAIDTQVHLLPQRCLHYVALLRILQRFKAGSSARILQFLSFPSNETSRRVPLLRKLQFPLSLSRRRNRCSAMSSSTGLPSILSLSSPINFHERAVSFLAMDRSSS